MTTHIMEGLDASLLVLDQQKVKAGDFESKVTSSFRQSDTMSSQKPVLGEDCTALKLIECRIRIP